MRVMVGSLVVCAAAFAQGPIEEGNRAFSERRYHDAVRHYLEAQKGGFDPDLLFNLGNAYAETGDVGGAVLSYERALLLAPRDRRARDALDALRRRSGLESDLDAGWRDFHRYLTADEWTWLVVAACGLLLAALVGRRRLSRAALARIAIAAALVALLAATAIVKHALGRDRAIVVTTTELRVSPYGATETSGKVIAGQVAFAARSFDDFVRVRLPGAAAAWIERFAVERVVP